MSYVDGFVAAVPTANRQIYKTHVEAAAVVFKDHGALKIVKCWGDDVPEGNVTSFPMAVQCKLDETVAFSWIVWPSRAARDAGMKRVLEGAAHAAWSESDALRRRSPDLWRLRSDPRRLTRAVSHVYCQSTTSLIVDGPQRISGEPDGKAPTRRTDGLH
jgi:uncharacterized protein YbaA (DUF1428 family)